MLLGPSVSGLRLLCPSRMNLIGGVRWFYPHFSTTCEFSVDPPSFILATISFFPKGPVKLWPTICMVSNATVGCGFKHFLLFSPGKLGKMNPFWLLHIFQTGWFNHQLEYSTKNPVLSPLCLGGVFCSPECSKAKSNTKNRGVIIPPPEGFVLWFTRRHYQGRIESPLYGGHKAEKKKVKIWGLRGLFWVLISETFKKKYPLEVLKRIPYLIFWGLNLISE